MSKLYCVHVYERPYVYENVRADSASAAEALIIERDWAGDYSDIADVHVLWQCPCGTANPLDGEVCGDCGDPS